MLGCEKSIVRYIKGDTLEDMIIDSDVATMCSREELNASGFRLKEIISAGVTP